MLKSTITITINTEDGPAPKKIQGYWISDELAIHHDYSHIELFKSSQWTLTHVLTGLTMAKNLRTRKEAVLRAKRILSCGVPLDFFDKAQFDAMPYSDRKALQLAAQTPSDALMV